ncbi:MAG TPA: hypothetical protein VG820_11740, partial [Fimbriimonadaceae bacterium]|nr:hypothetical protein [Fimbriimonadaceae bacterium]
ICDRCGEIAEGEMCMHCGHHLPPPRPDFYDPDSYFAIYGYHNPAIFKFIGWFFIPTTAIALAEYFFRSPILAYTSAAFGMLFLLIPVGIVSLTFARRFLLPTLVGLIVAAAGFAIMKPDDWRYALAVASLLAIIAGVLLFLWLVFSDEWANLWSWTRRTWRHFVEGGLESG